LLFLGLTLFLLARGLVCFVISFLLGLAFLCFLGLLSLLTPLFAGWWKIWLLLLAGAPL
jgi:hypothetical protein